MKEKYGTKRSHNNVKKNHKVYTLNQSESLTVKHGALQRETSKQWI